MDNKYAKILSDYNNCIDLPDCEHCKAWKTIEDSDTTWCEFLRERDKKIRDRIEQALE